MNKDSLELWGTNFTMQPISYKITELAEGFVDNGESGGAWCLNKHICLRPSFQRNAVWNEDQNKKLITTIANNAPIGTIYLGQEVHPDGSLADLTVVIDGQQRLIALCRFLDGQFSITYNGKNLFYEDLYYELPEVWNIINNYQIDMYKCLGSLDTQLKWFEKINANSVVLTDQERRNAIFMGEGTELLKHYFSVLNCAGYTLSRNITSSASKWNRQGLLETALKWVSNDDILTLMNKCHNNIDEAQKVCDEFYKIIDWINSTFINQAEDRLSLMKTVDWGWLYNNFHNITIDPDEIEKELIALLRGDENHEEVEKCKGIYTYIFTHNPKELNFRTFSDAIKRRTYERQNHKCALCGTDMSWANAQADHKIPWSEGGRTIEENCQILCKKCNQHKSNKIWEEYLNE